MDSSKYSISEGTYGGKRVIWVEFRNTSQQKSAFKAKFPRAKWSVSERCWYLPDTDLNRTALGLKKPVVAAKGATRIHANNQNALKAYIAKLKAKSKSPHTVKVYTNEFAQFLAALHTAKAEKLSAKKITAYFLYCAGQLQLSETHLNSRMNAVKFYYKRVLGNEALVAGLPRPKKPANMRKTLNPEEIERLLAVALNEKHKLVLLFAYKMGLRISEIVRLRVSSLDMEKMYVTVPPVKGKPARKVQMPKTMLKDVKKYLKAYQPKVHLFEGLKGGPYTTRSAQLVLKTALKNAGIKKKVGVYGLRYSYATHLTETETDSDFMEKLTTSGN